MAKSVQKQSDHPILEASKVSKRSSARLLKELSYCVPWEHFSGALGVEEFEQYKLVAMCDLWDRGDHNAVLGSVGLTEERAREIRKTDVFATIKNALETAMLESTKSFTDKEWIERTRQSAWRRIHGEVSFGADQERAIAAARDITDRTSPKATRAESGGDRVLYIPEGLIELLATSMRESKMIEGEVVDVTEED